MLSGKHITCTNFWVISANTIGRNFLLLCVSHQASSESFLIHDILNGEVDSILSCQWTVSTVLHCYPQTSREKTTSHNRYATRHPTPWPREIYAISVSIYGLKCGRSTNRKRSVPVALVGVQERGMSWSCHLDAHLGLQECPGWPTP